MPPVVGRVLLMSGIGDEIREFVRRSYEDEHMDPRKLIALADRVDTEMVELPKDRDGKPIHIGDTVYAHGFPDGNGGATCEVCSIEFNEGRESSIEITTSGIVTYRTPSSLTHELPDSFERIADELDDLSESGEMADETSADMRELAGRIRNIARGRDDG